MNPYDRDAIQAVAFARMSEARHRAATGNARQDVVTCTGCKAASQSGNWGRETCKRLCADRLCQRQVFLTVTMARIVAEVVIEMVRAGATGAVIRAVIREIRTVDIVGLLEG